MDRLLHTDHHNTLLSERSLDELEAVIATPGWFWIDLVDPSPERFGEIASLLGLHALDVEDVLGPVERPKVEEREDYLFLVAHTISRDETRLGTVEVDAFVGPNYLITARAADAPGIDRIQQLIAIEAIAGPDALIALILDLFARRMLPLTDQLDEEIDRLEDLALVADDRVPTMVQALRRDVIRLRRVLLPQRDVAMLLQGSALMSERAKRRLESAHGDYSNVVDELEVARELLASVLDSHRATVAEGMNQVMKVLTVFSAIILPLTLAAGIYGMNFSNMPELEWRWGYFAVLAIMAVTAVGLWSYFAWRGFIGRPRVPRVDRAVGRGLAGMVHLTLAPVRGLAHLVLEPRQQTDEGGDAR